MDTLEEMLGRDTCRGFNKVDLTQQIHDTFLQYDSQPALHN